MLRILGAFCLIIFSINAFAINLPMTSPWIYNIGIGAYDNPTGTDSSDVRISTIETDRLMQNSQQHFPILNFSVLGSIQPVGALKRLLIGPSLYYHHVDFQGDVHQFMLPTLNNYTYEFTGNVIDGLIEVEALFQPFLFTSAKLSPFMIVGAGGSVSSVEYSETARPGVPPRTIRSTSSNLALNFIAEVGAGVLYSLNNEWDVSLRYLYQFRNTSSSSSKSVNRDLLKGVRGNLNTSNLLVTLSHQMA